MDVPFNQLSPNNYNPRKLFRDASMEELKASIEQHGLIEPLVVRKVKTKYEVVAGMRRYYALKSLGVATVECSVKDLTDDEAKLVSLIENIQRDNLTPIEEARAYAINLGIDFDFSNRQNFGDLLAKKNKDLKKFAETTGKSDTTVYNRLRLLVLPEDIQSAIHLRKFKRKLHVAETLTKLGKIEDVGIAQEYMLELYNEYINEDLDMKELERRINNKIDFEERKAKADIEIGQQEIDDLEEKIRKTEISKNTEIGKLMKIISEIFKRESLELDIDFEEEDIDDENLLESSRVILEVVNNEKKKYVDDTEYNQTVDEINALEKSITDIGVLLSRIDSSKGKTSIDICPYCHAGIDLDVITEKEKIYRGESETLKQKRANLAGISSFLEEVSKKVSPLITSIEAKEKFIEDYKTDLEALQVVDNGEVDMG